MKNPFYVKHGKEIERLRKFYVSNHIEANSLFGLAPLADAVKNNVLRHELRPYQMEALFTMDALNKARQYTPEWAKALKDKSVEASMAFHMATGSGKTVLIAGMIYWLHKTQGTKNFLIFTPPSKSVVYHKTRINFAKDSAESVWGKGCDLNIEVIHGDNFDSARLYDSEPDIRIFIFNTEKFSATAKKTKLPQEMSRWTDGAGNLISLETYLQEARDLIIITDEAHHSAADKAIRQMIGGFKPQLLLEFTATSQDTQHVVYDYGIDILLSEGLCKTIRVLGVLGESRKDLLSLANRRKLVVTILLHFAKGFALRQVEDLAHKKVVSLIKVKDTKAEGRQIFAWLKEGLKTEPQLFLDIIREMEEEKHPIGQVVSRMFTEHYQNNIDALMKDIEILMGRQAMEFFDDSGIENERLFSHISTNDIQLIVYNDRLNEGIDLPNIYNIAVINDTDSGMLTTVKQVIGRGVRLFPETSPRRYDDTEDITLKAVEQLHVISDKGKNFEQAINQLREEWELINRKFFASESELKKVTNTVLHPIVGKALPSFSASHRLRKNDKTGQPMNVVNIISDIKEVVEDFLPHCCFGTRSIGSEDNILRYIPASRFSELEIGHSEDDIKFQLQLTGDKTQLVIKDEHMKQIRDKIVKTVKQVGNIPAVTEAFYAYGRELNARKLYYYRTNEADENNALDIFRQQFEYFYRPHILKRLTWLQQDPVEEMMEYPLDRIFRPYEIDSMAVYDPSEDLKKQIQNGIWFDAKKEKWSRAYYQYQKFDSATEYKAAALFDKLCASIDNAHWITNNRKYYLSYGDRKYFPDFIIVTTEQIIVVEIKGEFFEDSMKTALLRLYGKTYAEQKIHAIMLYEEDIDGLLEMKIVGAGDVLEKNRLADKRGE